MRKERFNDTFKNVRIYKDLYEKPCKRDWVAKAVFLIQMLLTLDGRCNRYFWDIRLKILRLPNSICSFSLCWQQLNCFRVYVSKVNCFRVYRKWITWSSHAKGLFPSFHVQTARHNSVFIFQKWTAFVFTESWSRDLVIQRVYSQAFTCKLCSTTHSKGPITQAGEAMRTNSVWYPLSNFSVGVLAGRPGKGDYLESFHPGSRHHKTGISANRANMVVIKSQSWLLLRLNKVPGSLQSEPAQFM